MEKATKVQEIRQLLSEADTEKAIEETRGLLVHLRDEEALVQLDMIQAEWSDVHKKTQYGVLSADDHLRYQSISRAKLMALLLHLEGEGDLAASLVGITAGPSLAPPQNIANTAEAQNSAFKNGLKNTVGVLFFMGALGSIIQKDYISSLCIGVAGLMTFVPTLQAIEKAIGYRLLSWHKYVIVVGALLLFGAYATPKKPVAEQPKLEQPG